MKKFLIKSKGEKKNMFFSVIPFQYYGLEFYSKSDRGGFWAVIFYDKKGRKLVADHYSSFERSENFKKNIFYFKGKENSVRGELIFKSKKGDYSVRDISIWRAEKREVIKWSENIYMQIPAFNIPMPENRCKNIPETIKKLKKRGKLRIVLLGDSIMNDTGNSPFDILLENIYPSCRIEVITSVRGSTGCWYYEKGSRIKKFILDYSPDLLIIGGISNRNNVKAIRNVIRKVRKFSEKIEIMVLSRAFGRKKHYEGKWSFEIPKGNNSYRKRLKKMAEEENVEFFDIEGYFGQYVRNSGLPYEFFMRDKVHANVYGRQIVARIIFKYFSC